VLAAPAQSRRSCRTLAATCTGVLAATQIRYLVGRSGALALHTLPAAGTAQRSVSFQPQRRAASLQVARHWSPLLAFSLASPFIHPRRCFWHLREPPASIFGVGIGPSSCPQMPSLSPVPGSPAASSISCFCSAYWPSSQGQCPPVSLIGASWRLTPPSSGRLPAGFACFQPPLMSNVRPHESQFTRIGNTPIAARRCVPPDQLVGSQE
jgi:hypothetical protein